MASASPSLRRLTEQEYLALDRESDFKSEFIDGEMRAMAGGSLRHSALAVRSGINLNEKLAGRGCTVFSSDARVRTPSTGSYVYPDISVVCGSIQTVDNTVDILLNPILVVEVLSPSTEDYDFNRKFALYREIESVKEYLMIHAKTIAVEHFSRQPDNSWIYRETKNLDAGILLPALDISLSLESLYGSTMSIPG
jgi:Uma2 family endonuclease